MERGRVVSLVLVTAALCTSTGALTEAATGASITRPRPRSLPQPLPRSNGFIRSSCQATRYPALCERYLSTYSPPVEHSPRGVAEAALAVSADKARSASAFVSRMSTAGASSVRSREAGAVRDCLETMRDSADRLRRSVGEMGLMGPARSAGFEWHLSNVQTWVSAALTDESTCLDSLSQNAGPGVQAAIRNRVVEVAQVTSIALALVNRIRPSDRPGLSLSKLNHPNHASSANQPKSTFQFRNFACVDR